MDTPPVPPTVHPGKRMLLGITLAGAGILVATGAYVAMTTRNSGSGETVNVTATPDGEGAVFVDPQTGISFSHPQMDPDCCRISPPEGAPDARLIGTFAMPGTVAPDRDQPFDGFAVYLVDTTLSLEEFVSREKTTEENAAEDGNPVTGSLSPVETLIGPDKGMSLNNANRPHLTGYYVKTADGTVLAVLKSQATPEFTGTFEKILASFRYSVALDD